MKIFITIRSDEETSGDEAEDHEHDETPLDANKTAQIQKLYVFQWDFSLLSVFKWFVFKNEKINFSNIKSTS